MDTRKNFYGGPRGFSSTFENSQTIVAHHNEVVSDEDDVYCLGDCMLNDNDYGLEMIKSLKGKIHIIRGNHDSDTRIELYKTLPNVVEVCEAKTIKVVIGPEGGIEDNEYKSLLDKGFYSISLGKRILRSETAAFNILSKLGYIIEEENE